MLCVQLFTRVLGPGRVRVYKTGGDPYDIKVRKHVYVMYMYGNGLYIIVAKCLLPIYNINKYNHTISQNFYIAYTFMYYIYTYIIHIGYYGQLENQERGIIINHELISYCTVIHYCIV